MADCKVCFHYYNEIHPQKIDGEVWRIVFYSRYFIEMERVPRHLSAISVG